MPSKKIKNSVSFAGYIADVCFPGKIKGEFHTKVGVVANFLQLDIVDIVFCWKRFPLSCDFEQVTFCSVKPEALFIDGPVEKAVIGKELDRCLR